MCLTASTNWQLGRLAGGPPAHPLLRISVTAVISTARKTKRFDTRVGAWVQEFSAKLRSIIPNVNCTVWNLEAHIDVTQVRELMRATDAVDIHECLFPVDSRLA